MRSVITTIKTLPFHLLFPEEFERMTLWLINKRGYLRPQHLGEGGHEQGRDIVAYKSTESGEELWYFQCKRYQKIGASTLKAEIDKYNQLVLNDPQRRPVGVVFVTNAVLTALNEKTVSESCKKYGYAYEFWTHSVLDMYVKEHSDIVNEFFGPHLNSQLTPPARHQLPSSIRDFTGRQNELRELHDVLKRDKAIIIGLFGEAGVGKTSLALKFAEQVSAFYSDAQLFITLKGTSLHPLTDNEVIRQIIHSYHPTIDLPETQSELFALYRSTLYQQKAIIFLDDVANAEQIVSIIPPGNCLLIITSRHRFVLPGLYQKHVRRLPVEDAEALLLKISNRIEEHVSEIAKLCEYLPIALRLAASALVERVDLSPSIYIRRLTNAQQRLDLIDASLSLSYDLLDDDLKLYWCILAIFPGSFDLFAVAEILDVNEDTAQDIMSVLVSYNLVEWDSVQFRYYLHELTRLFIDARLPQPVREISHKRFAMHYLQVLGEANDLYQEGKENILKGVEIFNREWENLRIGQFWAATHIDNDKDGSELCNDYPKYGFLLLDLCRHPEEHIQWIETGIKAAKILNYHLDEESLLCNMGTAYMRLGRSQHAIDFFQQSLTMAKLRGDLNKITLLLINLTSAYLHMGDVLPAISIYDEILHLQPEITDQISIGILHNLGAIHYMMGNNQEGIHAYKILLDLFREHGDWRREGSVLINLSNAYANMGETLQAIEYLHEALDIAKTIGAKDLECDALGKLSLFYIEDEPEQAIELLEKALVIAQNIGDKSTEAENWGRLGNAYRIRGEMEIAKDFCNKALLLAREIDDKETESIVNATLSVMYYQNGEFGRSIFAAKMAWKYRNQIGHIDALQGSIILEKSAIENEAKGLGELSAGYFKAGNYAYAISFAKRGLEFYRRIEYKDGECLLLGIIAECYMVINKTCHAIRYFEQSLAIAQENDNHRLEALFTCSLGMLYHRQGSLTQTMVDAMHKSIGYLEEINHPKANVLAPSIKEIQVEFEAGKFMEQGKLYAQSDQIDLAIDFFKKALNKYHESEKTDRLIMTPLLRLIEYYGNKNQLPLAIDYIQEFIKISHNVGDYDFEAGMSWLLGEIYQKEGQIDKAILAMQVSVDYNYKTGQFEKAQQQAFHISSLRDRLNHASS